ncbi:benzoate/H(+) symporter BenE family transporter [Sessilibacter sp. MAH2]
MFTLQFVLNWMCSMPLLSLSRASAGFIAVLVGYASSAAIVFQAVSTLGASSELISSWFWSLGIGLGITCIGLSYLFKQPVVTAWSTPGAAILVVGLEGLSMSQAVGVFLFSSALIFICGITGIFDRLTRVIPIQLAAAMLAGVLFKFGVDIFTSLESNTILVVSMLAVFFLVKPLSARYVVPLTLLVGFSVAFFLGQLNFQSVAFEFATPVFTAPSFSLSAIIGVGIPLFLVTMASQNMPGIAVIRANGYTTPSSPLISATGLTGLILAPFGGFAFNLAAITAAICLSKEADPDPKTRFWAAIWAGIFYLFAGTFAVFVVGLLETLPKALILAIAGLALVGTIANSLNTALSNEPTREAAVVTFLVTASGFSYWGIGSAFWAIIIGSLYLLCHRYVSLKRN